MTDETAMALTDAIKENTEAIRSGSGQVQSDPVSSDVDSLDTLNAILEDVREVRDRAEEAISILTEIAESADQTGVV